MCRVAVREIAALERAPAQTRHWAADRLRRWDLEAEVDRTVLVLNELVTNAVVHSPGGAGCRLSVDGGSLEVVVFDRGPGPSRRALRAAGAPDPDAWEHPSGRGLLIVAAVADGWGATFVAGRAGVWARWALTAGWTHTRACVCDGTAGDLLGSGGRVVAMPGPWDEGTAVDARRQRSSPPRQDRR